MVGHHQGWTALTKPWRASARQELVKCQLRAALTKLASSSPYGHMLLESRPHSNRLFAGDPPALKDALKLRASCNLLVLVEISRR